MRLDHPYSGSDHCAEPISLPELSIQLEPGGQVRFDPAFHDLAGFGELTWHITHDWQVTAGARLFRQTFDTKSTSSLLLCGSVCAADLIDPTGLSRSSSLSQFRSGPLHRKATHIRPKSALQFLRSLCFRRTCERLIPQAHGFAALQVSFAEVTGSAISPCTHEIVVQATTND